MTKNSAPIPLDQECPLCGHHDPKTLFEAPAFDSGLVTFHVTGCEICGLFWTLPQLDAKELATYYTFGYYGSGKSKFRPLIEWVVKSASGRRARKLRKHINSGQTCLRILDVGCGRANLLSAFYKMGHECHGLERSDFDADAIPDGVSLHRGAIHQQQFEPESFDLVIFWHSLEHLSDPLADLNTACKLLKRGGILAVAVPNFQSRQARYFGADWFHLDLPRHVWHFSSRTLDRYWSDAGLEKMSGEGLSFEQNLFGFIQSAVNRLLPSKANAMYRAVKSGAGSHWLPWLPLIVLLMPFAILECLLSASQRHGATVVHIVRKP